MATSLTAFSRGERGVTFRMILLGSVAFDSMVLIVVAIALWPSTDLWRLSGGACLLLGGAALHVWALASASSASLGVAYSGVRPNHIVSRGPYAYVRHPIYLSYLLSWAGGPMGSALIWAWLPLLLLGPWYWVTIRSEEQELVEGPLRDEYLQYRASTGALVPRLLPTRPDSDAGQ